MPPLFFRYSKVSQLLVEQAGSDSDVQSPVRAPIRVRFARPETEKQKKRREESAFHRSKVIEQDPWISLEIHGKEVFSFQSLLQFSCYINFQ